ncbi:MAG: hypothetical protein U0S50_01415 [Sphingopyxis sp.]|uniref:hypothetical protein n=1 Tax=Sphingopyxis sp. TaxID=1908224 RepID=UPI002ABCBFA9|nr:hypothetical protein [Sphingopyxis sp.]MDZ3830459.1 hypothetical protein [Sphingopyxis sp.]
MGLLSAFRRPGIVLLLPVLLALAARMLVAPGWMIESDAGGTITVRICSDPANPGGTVTIPIERAAGHDPGEAQQHCPWGALAAAPLLPHTPSLPAVALFPGRTLLTIPALGYAPGIASPLPPSTGPPAFA